MIVQHSHGLARRLGPPFLWAAALNAAYVVFEALFGYWIGSLALLADAAHNLTDVGGLLIAWGAVVIGQRRPTVSHTYGLGRATVPAALANGIALLIGVGAIAREAIGRIFCPRAGVSDDILWVAAIGIVINFGTALLFLKGRSRDINVGRRILAHGRGRGGIRGGGHIFDHHRIYRVERHRSGRRDPHRCRRCLVGVRIVQVGYSPE